jgi:hypothetical protein
MPVSDYLIERLGFEAQEGYESVEAAFFTLAVYEVRGFTLRSGDTATHQFTIRDERCVVGVGNSVNEVCRALTDDDYHDDEAEWAKLKKATPPFVIVQFGPTRRHVASAPRVRLDGELLLTYDAFGAAKSELAALEGALLPSIETALHGIFGGARSVVFRPIDTTRYGLTPDGKTLIDLRVDFKASAYVSTSLVEGELCESLEAVAAAAQRLPPGQAKFFQAGLRTDDLQKRFLYLFISLEREVHRVFRSTTRSDHIANGLSCLERVTDPLSELIEKRLAWNNVADRFIWCVASTWTDLGPGEVDLFRHLKRIRDGIAHGSGPDPTVEDVNALERLTRRSLLWRADQGIDDVFGDEAV